MKVLGQGGFEKQSKKKTKCKTMNQEELKIRITQGESSTLQFKLQWSDNEKITKELVAFANSRGGSIVFGVEDKTGRIEGLSYDDVQTISSKVGNMAEMW